MLSIFTWAGFCAICMFIDRIYIGDGTAKTGRYLELSLLWLPLAYLFIVVLSTLPFIRRWLLSAALGIGHALLVP